MGSCADAGFAMQSQNDCVGLERIRHLENFLNRRAELDHKSGATVSLAL